MEKIQPSPSGRRGFLAMPSSKRLLLVGLTSLALGCFTLVGGFAYIRYVLPLANHQKKGVLPSTKPGEIAFHDLERMNILVLGIDNNYDSKGMPFTKGARSDSMMVVSLSSEGKFLNVVSIPRDTQVLISERYGYEKINAAYSFGGPRQAIQTVERFLKVPIHHFLVVKIAGAKKVIDALGGLPLDVEKDMDYDDNWGHLHVHLKKGHQTLSGENAVGYARFRKDEEGDRGRMRRQQQVIRAMVELLKSSRIVTRFPELAKAVKETLQTDMEIAEMVDLARLYRGFDRKKMRAGKIEGDDAMVNGVAVIVPYGPQNDKVVQALLKSSGDTALHHLRIRVLNGSKESGAAQRMADELTVDGLQVVKVDLADRDNYAVTEVIEHTQNPRLHGRLLGLFKGSAFKRAPDKAYDVTIVVGADQVLASARSAPPPPPVNLVSQPAVPQVRPQERPSPTVERGEPLPQQPSSPPPLEKEGPPHHTTPAPAVDPATSPSHEYVPLPAPRVEIPAAPEPPPPAPEPAPRATPLTPAEPPPP